MTPAKITKSTKLTKAVKATTAVPKAATKVIAKATGMASGKAAAKTAAKPAVKATVKAAANPSIKPAVKPTVKPTGKAPAKTVKSLPAKQKGKTSDRLDALDSFKRVSAKVAQQEMDLLCQRYPDADCELDFDTPFQLITAVIMSAQTTDTNVNKVTKNLFSKYPDARSLAAAPLDHIKEIIRSTGYYNAKATNIQNCAAKLVEKFGGEVPAKLEDLITLPGVGRKTANVVLGVAYGVPGWTVDTHVQRLSKRLGFSEELDPEKIEYELQKLFPGQDWSKLSITLIWHGRRTCFARKPNCEECPVNHLCPSSLMPA